jgi:Lamin Tail Domain
MARLRILLVLLLAVALVPAATGASSSSVVVSQLFGGGGNSGAPFTNDFVELFNRGSSAVDVTGWTVQYATAAGTTWQTTPLAGSIPAGGYYLVQLASGGTAGSPLPTPDATGTTNAAATSGKIALVRDAAALTCGATPGSCSANSLVEDLVGYGAASDYEGAAAPGLSATTAAIRAGGGCIDTDANGSDLAAGAPAPRNAAAPVQPCASEPPPPQPGDSETATVDIDIDPVLSITLERSSLSFGRAVAGGSPAPISERVTVLSNNAAGYALSVQRSAFAPADLPLALQASAPPGGVLGPPFAGGAFVPIPVAPAPALPIGTTSAPSADGGDAWQTNVGFGGPLPVVAAGRYTATLTFTVVAR